jgi:hypothetical protein
MGILSLKIVPLGIAASETVPFEKGSLIQNLNLSIYVRFVCLGGIA